MTKILHSFAECKILRSAGDRQIGFVPTMGALHEGHVSLLAKARRENDWVVASVFVNPTQFNNAADFEKYPATFVQDLELLEREGIDFVVYPQASEMYADLYSYRVHETSRSSLLEGAYRPGHFEGMLTVVMKLFQWVRPQRAYFGEKDYQQLTLIEGMCRAFFLDIEIVRCPTVRESSGLAMSSRNVRLTPEQRQIQAPLIYKILSEACSAREARRQLEAHGFKIDYVEDQESRRLAAVWLGEVRLIDNVVLATQPLVEMVP